MCPPRTETQIRNILGKSKAIRSRREIMEGMLVSMECSKRYKEKKKIHIYRTGKAVENTCGSPLYWSRAPLTSNLFMDASELEVRSRDAGASRSPVGMPATASLFASSETTITIFRKSGLAVRSFFLRQGREEIKLRYQKHHQPRPNKKPP